MTEQTDWVSAVAILASGLILGLMLMFYLRRRGPAGTSLPAPDRELQDLESRRDLLIAQLRELDDAGADVTPEQTAERRRLELAAADVLRLIDNHQGLAAAKPSSEEPQMEVRTADVAGAARAAARNGFIWGVLSIAVLAGIGFFVYKSATARGANEGLTGSAMAPNEMKQPAPQDPALLALEAAVQKNPNDIDQRIELARVYLERENLMGVFEQTGFVLKSNPAEPRAMTYQALVRLAMGQTDEATTMLEKATKLAPDFIDGSVALAWVYAQQGRASDAEATMRDAMQRHPQERARLEQVLVEMKARKDAPPGAKPGGPVDPNAPLPPGHPSVDGASPSMSQGSAPAPVPQGGAKAIRITLDLDPSAKSRSGLGTVVYVFARPAGVMAGPPVAAKRFNSAAWPMTFELSSTDSMMGQPLPDKVRIEARLDSDGDARTKGPGDRTAVVDSVRAGATITLNLK